MEQKYAVVQITAKGEVNIVPCNSYKLSLEQLYNWTDCDTIQILNTYSWLLSPDKKMVVDDNGKCLGKEINKIATELYGIPYDYIVGDVVIGTLLSPNKDDEPDIFAMTYAEAEAEIHKIAKLLS